MTPDDPALGVLGALPHWGWVRIFRAVPKPIRDRIYSLIARNRYRLFGRHAVCDLGGVKFADRVVS